MNLLIDIGNTRTKAAWVDGQSIQEVVVISQPNDWIGLIKKNPRNILISSVKTNTEEIIKPLRETGMKLLFLDRTLRFPLELDYQTPETLGMDRLAAAVGAFTLSPGSPVLSVMAGTCLTYDLSDGGKYLGGAISPGVAMRLKAMHAFTDKLPMLEISQEGALFPGKSTSESMICGAQEGARMEIMGRISDLRKDYPNLVVFISGGDAHVFESSVNPPIFVVPDLIFVGLNRILEYNV